MAKKKSFMNKAASVIVAMESDTYHPGFSTETRNVDTGNLSLNRMMSGLWDGGFLFGKNYVLYGESGSGKSLLAAYVCGHAQEKYNANIVWLDVEKASDPQFFSRANVSTDKDRFEYAQMATLEDIYSTVLKITKLYREAVKGGEKIDPLIFVVDSWSAFITAGQEKQMKENKLTGDQGQKAKQVGDVIIRLNHTLTGLPIMILGIAHIYDNQDMYGRKHKTTMGHKLQFMATGCLMLSKAELKADDKNMDSATQEYVAEQESGYTKEMKKKRRSVGFVCTAENLKSRVSKPFQKVVVQIPYHSGMDKYSGLFDTLMEEGSIKTTSLSWYSYIKNNEVIKFQKSAFENIRDDILACSPVDISDAGEHLERQKDPIQETVDEQE